MTLRVPTMQEQEIPLHHPESVNLFLPCPDKPFVATPTAIELYSHETILTCLHVLRTKADAHGGLDYLQVFADPNMAENLWFIEDGPGGCITALLPSDH